MVDSSEEEFKGVCLLLLISGCGFYLNEGCEGMTLITGTRWDILGFRMDCQGKFPPHCLPYPFLFQSLLPFSLLVVSHRLIRKMKS
jgi:hypothetical protein